MMLLPAAGFRLPAVVVLFVAVFATEASASDVCVVQQSADGYVALRATPSTRGDILARTKKGDGVVIQLNDTGDQIVNGSWLRVLHFPDSVVHQKTDLAHKAGTVGWMHKRYVNDCG